MLTLLYVSRIQISLNTQNVGSQNGRIKGQWPVLLLTFLATHKIRAIISSSPICLKTCKSSPKEEDKFRYAKLDTLDVYLIVRWEKGKIAVGIAEVTFLRIHRRQETGYRGQVEGKVNGCVFLLPRRYQRVPDEFQLVLHPSLCTSVWLDTSVCLADCRRVVFELPVQTDRCVHGEPLVTCNLCPAECRFVTRKCIHAIPRDNESAVQQRWRAVSRGLTTLRGNDFPSARWGRSSRDRSKNVAPSISLVLPLSSFPLYRHALSCGSVGRRSRAWFQQR